MEQVSTHRPEHSGAHDSGRGALGWAAFLVILMVLVAAIIAGAIDSRLSPSDNPTSRPLLPGAPKPSPTPLPKPGPPRPGTLIAAD